MFYNSVTKQVRNGNEYSWDSAGIGLNRHDIVTDSLLCTKSIWKKNARKLGISLTLEYIEVRKMHAQIGHKNRNSCLFLTINGFSL